jgi:hypothetical protein
MAPYIHAGFQSSLILFSFAVADGLSLLGPPPSYSAIGLLLLLGSALLVGCIFQDRELNTIEDHVLRSRIGPFQAYVESVLANIP